MEVSPFPFLNHESFASFFTSFQEQPDQKRQKTDPDDSDATPFRDILSSLLSFDEDDNSKSQFQFQSQSQSQTMTDSFYPIDGFFEEPDHKDPPRPKRARTPNGPDANVAATASEASAQSANGGGARRLWVKSRSKAWWDQCSHPDFPESEFRRAFKMSKSTFEFICSELDPVINKKDTMLRQAIPVRQRVAVCIWRLATGEPLRLVSKKFGLGISTCHKLVLEVCGAIKSVMMSKFLNWPDEERMTRVKREFELVSGIPNVGGSIYTTHVPIIAPKVNGPAYFNKRHTERNQKTSYSITVQGVVDSKGVFTDVCIGWPGSMSDDKVLEKSALSQRASRGLLKDVWIVGNGGYPLMDWVLVPYAQQNLWTQRVFNEKAGEVERVAKEAFSRLKGRWSCLQKRTEVKLQDLPVVLGACCVLHNICEMRNEAMEPSETGFDLFDDEIVPDNAVRSVDAMRARDQIAHRLLHHSFADTGLP
ncbi:hypothetical protein RHMOL_Rhmol05G0014400 [Rhododendron molle]|uniref:Uncharacterized protein n=1 Tax=Rhododendron molle TaxID=49168 RepID=A0ACC0NJP1_RHOML|nr:hypothetical protein RHMOL_Rhmol05G0014400 [Rhododendron molle]